MKKKHIIYIILGVIVLTTILTLIVTYQKEAKVAPEPLVPQVPVEASKPVEPYSLDKDKMAAGQTVVPSAVGDLKEVYEKYPKSDVGANIIESWAKIKPEDKAKIQKAMDRDIEESKEILRQNPEDKKAKHLLKIAEMMKMLASKNFNIKAEDELVSVQAEDSSKK